jgi:RNA polymerase sigma-70 factor (ECF subfamily)
MADGRLTRVLAELRRTSAEAEAAVSDARLLERFTRGADEAAFELLVWRHQRMVLGVCRRVLGDRHDAEDAFQATFLTLAKKAGALRRREALAAWLYRVAYRVSLTARAGRARRAAHERPLPAAEAVVAPPDATAERRDLAAAVDDEVSRLPERFRAAVVLCYLEGKTVEEAAAQLGCPRGTVASRLARARERLGARLARRGLAPAAGGVTAALAEAASSLAPADGLVRAAVRAAGAARTGAAAGAEVPGRVVQLSEEVIRAMFVKKVLTGATVAAVLAGALLLGSGLAFQAHPSALAESPAAAPAADDGVKAPPADDARRAKADEPAAEVPRVNVSRPVRREVAPYVDFPGHLEAVRVVKVMAPVDGQVAKVHVKGGAEVKKGQLLFDIDPAGDRATRRRAEADLLTAEARYKEASQKVARLQKAFGEGTVAKATIDEAIEVRNGYKAEYEDAQARVAHVRERMALGRVTAPVAGRVSPPLVGDGDAVSARARPTLLVTITPLDPIGVRFDLDERSLLRFRRAARAGEVKELGGPLHVGVADEDGHPHDGTLDHVDEQVDPKNGTITFHGVLPNPEHLFLPGMFVGVRMPFGKPRSVLEVPDSAVQQEGSPAGAKSYVLVVSGRNVVERRDVKVGQADAGRWQIESGLRPEDWVVVSGLTRLHPGDRVEPRRVPAPRPSRKR